MSLTFQKPTNRSLLFRSISGNIPREDPAERKVQAIILCLRRQEKVPTRMFDLARKGNFDSRILITVAEQAQIAYLKRLRVGETWPYRKQLISIFVKLYAESGDKNFYATVCELSCVTERDKRLIFNARLHTLNRKVHWWHAWPFLLKRRD